jgi:AcrR family transcriptional regulator
MNKKELIINAALKLFVENGFHGTATAKIAQEAGVANGTLFQHFKTKDELIIALFVEFKKELADFVSTQSIKESFKGEIESQFIATLTWSLANTNKFHFIQQFHASPYIVQIGQEILEQQIKPHYELIAKGVESKQLKTLEIDHLYALISSQTFGLHHFLITKQYSEKKQQEIIQSTFEMLWDMIFQK